MKYIEVKEMYTFNCDDVRGMDQEMVMLQSADDHVFAVLASYLEQEVGPLMSPYNNGELVFRVNSNVNSSIVCFETLEGDVVAPTDVSHVFD